ncbi:dTDP-glucose 4,6-dehydratase [Halomonas organivorans]
MRILVTGGAGFIGSALVRFLIKETDNTVINVDKLTYAGSLSSLEVVLESERHVFIQDDICDRSSLREIFNKYMPEAVINMAAESHVDRSLDDPTPFVETNIVGTFNLIEEARRYWNLLDDNEKNRFRLVHVSTDEVFGDLGADGPPSLETSAYCPSSPYSASKSCADHLIGAWSRSYGIPAMVTRCTNNFGPYQYPEKLIPLMLLNALEGKALPVYGDGLQVRDWLFVEDHVKAIYMVLRYGKPSESYNISSDHQLTNMEMINELCDTLEQFVPSKAAGLGGYKGLIRRVEDRPGHDTRYALNSRKIKDEIGWCPRECFRSGLRKTVAWYLDNPEWCKGVQEATYQRQRLGLGFREVS